MPKARTRPEGVERELEFHPRHSRRSVRGLGRVDVAVGRRRRGGSGADEGLRARDQPAHHTTALHLLVLQEACTQSRLEGAGFMRLASSLIIVRNKQIIPMICA